MNKGFIKKSFNFLSFDWLESIYKPLFFTFLFIIIYLKTFDLNLNLYWDESIYLVPDFFDKGFRSFLPSEFKPELWHGHPPLFQILHYFLNQFIQPINYSAHLLGLCCFVFFIITLFYILDRHFDWKVALFTPILFINLPHVYAQSIALHPNFLMLGAGLLSLQLYLDKKFKLFLLFSMIAILTRESAIAFNIIILIHALFLVKKKEIKITNLFYILIPIFILILFFIYKRSISGQMVGHPYFQFRLSRGFSFLDIFKNNYASVKWSFLDSTWSTWSYPAIWVVIINFISVTKKQIKSQKTIKIDSFQILFISISLCFLSFYTLYADTIVRDLFLFSIVFFTYNIFFLVKGLKKPLFLLLFCGYVFYTSFGYHYSIKAIDTTNRAIRIKSQVSKEIAQIIDKNYPAMTKVGTGWPLYNFLRSPHYGYSSQVFDTFFEYDKGDVIINTNINTGYRREFKPDPNIWKEIYNHKREFRGTHYKIETQIFERKGVFNHD